MNSYKKILKENCELYKQYGVSYWGCFLKSSLVPLLILEDYFLAQSGIVFDLGCGEGIFCNVLARAFPHLRYCGIDKDAQKISLANKARVSNAEFRSQNVIDMKDRETSIVIFNDMLHHNSDENQELLLQKAKECLKDNGFLVIKEAEKNDFWDRQHTTFWDRRLYPHDCLNFHTIDQWKALLEKNGFEVLEVATVRHLWVASRTLLIARKLSSKIRIVTSKKIPEKGNCLRVFLTGATGFFGFHMAKYLLENGLGGKQVQLFVLARNVGRLDPEIREKVYVVQSDLEHLFEQSELLQGIDFVFHFAARVSIFASKKELDLVNVQGTQQLVRIFRNKNIKRFIHASTVGAVDRRPDDNCSTLLTEKNPPYPLTYYGLTKLKSEQAVIGSGLPYVIMRIPWGFGSHMTSDTHVRNLFEKVIQGSLVTKVNFPGRVSLVSVDDAVRAFVLVAMKEEAVNQIYFVSSYEPIALGALFQRMRKVLASEQKPIAIPSFLSAFARWTRRYLPLILQNLNSDVLCVSRIKIESIGYVPKTNLDNELRKLAHDIFLSRKKGIPEKVAVITGAGSGIGCALARQFFTFGFRVIAVDKNELALKKLQEEIPVEIWIRDLTLNPDRNQLIHDLESLPKIDCFVNNAGVGRHGKLVDTSHNDVDEIIDVNVRAMVHLSKAVLTKMQTRNHGTLVNIASSAALLALPYFSVYAASKAFVLQFSEAIGYEQRESIRVFTICPSGADTDFQEKAGVKKNSKERLLSPDEVAVSIHRIIQRQPGTYVIGKTGKILAALSRVLPRNIAVGFMGRLSEKMRPAA